MAEKEKIENRTNITHANTGNNNNKKRVMILISDTAGFTENQKTSHRRKCNDKG